MTNKITVRYWVAHTWPYSIDNKPNTIETKVYTITIDESEIFIKNGKKYYSLQSGHGQSTDLLIEESLMGQKEGTEMITCECGHAIDIHDLTGCNFPRPYAPNDCMCELSPEAIESRYWARRYYNRFNRMEYYANTLNDEVIKLREKLDAWEIVLTDSQTERDMLNVYADELKANLDIAVKGLEWYAISPMISGDAVARVTLAKIRKE